MSQRRERTPPRKDLPTWLWIASALGGPLFAWSAARAGYGMPISDPWRDLVLIALASVAEEIVFRGGLQRTLLRRPALAGHTGPLGAANVLSSALFAGLHLWRHPPLAALGVLPVSLLLGWVYERGGERLGPPIALHLYFNVALYACSYLALPPASPGR